MSNLPPKVVKYNIFKSLIYALNGLKLAFGRERNLCVQLVLGFIISSLAFWQNNYALAVAQIVVCSMVLSLELMNSVIESLCDLVNPGFSQQVKFIKDVSAGAVMTMALGWLVLIIYQVIGV